jgi:hypothetical protein
MVSALGHYLNKKLLVAIPSIFGDLETRVCTLTGIEEAGLWLESPELAQKLLHSNNPQAATPIFVPFAQIAYSLEPGAFTNRTSEMHPHEKASTISEKRSKTSAHKKKHHAD